MTLPRDASHPLLEISSIDEPPDKYLNRVSQVFTVFNAHTQDSGNVSYGVSVGPDRFFVKTAGRPDDKRPYLSHPERVALLHNAARLRRSCDHPALPPLRRVVKSPDGPLLVYGWVDGQLIRGSSATRDDPQSTFQRFRRLPVTEIVNVLEVIYDLHHHLAQLGWIAADFYDGCLIYDFDRRVLHIVDLDLYREGPFHNDMGRMFGSSRFMAPEEFELGAQIDQRTTVFTMGRTALVLLSDGTLDRDTFRGSGALYEVICQACAETPSHRFQSMTAFYTAWRDARLTK